MRKIKFARARSDPARSPVVLRIGSSLPEGLANLKKEMDGKQADI